MKSRYRVTAIAVLLLAAVGFAPQAEAVSKPPMSATNATVTADAADQPGRVAFITLLSTGFEPGQGFVVAALEPQQGWAASGLNAPWASVSAANPHTGAQHQRLQFNPPNVGANQVVLSPLVAGVLPNSPSTTTQWINISNDQGADYDVFGQAPSQAFITWRVKFHFSDGTGAPPGMIFILDDIGRRHAGVRRHERDLEHGRLHRAQGPVRPGDGRDPLLLRWQPDPHRRHLCRQRRGAGRLR